MSEGYGTERRGRKVLLKSGMQGPLGAIASLRMWPRVGFPGSAAKNLPTMQDTQETWVQSLGWEDLLEEGMETPSSILAWKIPWTEEPGGLQSMGSQKSCTGLKGLREREMRRGMVGRIRGRKTKERAVNNSKTGREAAAVLGGM